MSQNQNMFTSRKELARGTIIRGKWTNEAWTVHKCLGIGANGTVYSVRQTGGQGFALKICDESNAAAFEWGVLEALSKCTTAFPAPHCIDDSSHPRGLYFYVMEQVDGHPLDDVWNQLSGADIQQILIAMGRGMREIHQAGYAFCDVKGQNVLVSSRGATAIRFVDVGGVTPFGRSVRQFTPTSDCAYFGFGERRASAVYDIQAIALMVTCLEVPIPKELSEWPVVKRQEWLRLATRKIKHPNLSSLIEGVLQGRITTADEWVGAVQQLKFSQGVDVHSIAKQRIDWSERVMWVSLCCAIASTAGAWAVYLGVL